MGRQLHVRGFDTEIPDFLAMNGDGVRDFWLSYPPQRARALRFVVTNEFNRAPTFPIAIDACNGHCEVLRPRHCCRFHKCDEPLRRPVSGP